MFLSRLYINLQDMELRGAWTKEPLLTTSCREPGKTSLRVLQGIGRSKDRKEWALLGHIRADHANMSSEESEPVTQV